MNNILSLKTIGLSYASTNLSFAFALYFNISMFLLYHNPPLFSITCRTCPNVFLFGVQIPVDACPLFGLKRRSFLFVIDKKQPQPRLFLYTGESVRFNKNAHCFAVEPSGWRFVPRVNSLSSLFRRFAPSDSPRVHQWRCQKTTPQLYLPFGKLDCFAVIFCFAKLNFHFVKVKANIISLLANG